MTRTSPPETRPHTTGDHGQTDFDAVAAEYDESLPIEVLEHYNKRRAAFITSRTRPGSAILDVGCGTGVLAERLLREGFDVTGVDPFDAMLAKMRERDPRLKTVHAPGQHMPFEDNTFDLAYCVAVMHHVADPNDVHDTLVEMVRVVKPGGHVLVWDHNPRNPYWPILMKRVPQDTGAERLIPLKEILTGLKDGGATPIEVTPLGMMPDFTPTSLIPAVSRAEGLIERLPGIRQLCAHNVVYAQKDLT